MAKYILLFYPEYADKRGNLYKAIGIKDYLEMLVTPRGVRVVVYWLSRIGLLL
jgi:hypothetical protein